MGARFILGQISDLHVATGPRGTPACETLRRALDQLRPYRPDAILATGDLVNDAGLDEYERLAPILENSPAPLFLLPGNHDDPDLMRSVFSSHDYLPPRGRLSYAIDRWPVRIVMLDLIVRAQTYGEFEPADAEWLDSTLAAKPQTPTIVALHHPPFLTHERLFDGIGLRRRAEFERIIEGHRQVELIVCGHHHRTVFGRVAHAPAIVAPSTAFTFSSALHAEQPIGRKTAELPGFALHVWPEEDGPVASQFFEILGADEKLSAA